MLVRGEPYLHVKHPVFTFGFQAFFRGASSFLLAWDMATLRPRVPNRGRRCCVSQESGSIGNFCTHWHEAEHCHCEGKSSKVREVGRLDAQTGPQPKSPSSLRGSNV
jgi:hypothetical protein